MTNDPSLAKVELAQLMAACNRWSARLARLQATVTALEGPEAPEAHSQALQALQTALEQAQREREAALSTAADWEHKARTVGRQIAAERLARGKQLLALQQRIAQLERTLADQAGSAG